MDALKGEDGTFKIDTWLEGVLEKYCTNLMLRRTQSRGSDMFLFEKSEDELKKPAVDSIKLKIIDVQLEPLSTTDNAQDDEEQVDEPTEEDEPVVIADLLRAEIKYKLGENSKVKRTENFLIRLASAKIKSAFQHLLTKPLENEIREIGFHTKVIPTLEDWSFAHGFRIDLGVPICFYGHYEAPPPRPAPEEQVATTAEAGTSSDTAPTEKSNPGGNESFLNKICSTVKRVGSWSQHLLSGSGGGEFESNKMTEAVTMLITNDLEKVRFSISSDKLSIGQTKAALRELAQIHAISWAYQLNLDFESDQSNLLKDWPFLLQPLEAVDLCCHLTESGIDPVISILKLYYGSLVERSKIAKITTWLNHLRDQLRYIFETLLTPPEPPLPATIIHLDCQYQNIAFRPEDKINPPAQKNSACASRLTSNSSNPFVKPSSTKTAKTPSSTNNNLISTELKKNHKIECRITNWKLVTYGSPMHDVSFLFLTSLSADVRKAASSKLLEYYYSIFKETVSRFNLRPPFTLLMLESEYKKYFLSSFLFLLGNFDEQSLELLCEEGNEVDTNGIKEKLYGIYPFFDNFLEALHEVMDSIKFEVKSSTT